MTVEASPRPFESVVESLTTTTYDECRALPDAKVESRTAFEEMRNYLRDRYDGITVVSSFVETDGQVIDCVPADRYPAVTPPSAPPAPYPASASVPTPETYRASTPAFTSACPPNTIPMYRTTLEQLSRFRKLAAFHAKDRPHGVAARATEASSFGQKRYATGEQNIHCLGGYSHINVWNPFAAALNQATFSQQWHVAGHDGTWMQTVECGWHVDIARYGNALPHLFVYSTRQNYDLGHSFFNLDGGQQAYIPVTNPYVYPGAPLTSSITDGNQITHMMGFYLTAGAWWFYFDGHAVGRYPLSWFNNGPLTTGARRIKFGGEVGTNLTFWPPMGSGRHASAGYGKTAYQRAASVYPVAGGVQPAALSEAGSTTGSCYTINITNNWPGEWGTYLFYGGPGGSGC